MGISDGRKAHNLIRKGLGGFNITAVRDVLLILGTLVVMEGYGTGRMGGREPHDISTTTRPLSKPVFIMAAWCSDSIGLMRACRCVVYFVSTSAAASWGTRYVGWTDDVPILIGQHALNLQFV